MMQKASFIMHMLQISALKIWHEEILFALDTPRQCSGITQIVGLEKNHVTPGNSKTSDQLRRSRPKAGKSFGNGRGAVDGRVILGKREGLRMWQLYNGDCLEIMPKLESGLMDMILCDLPYGLTQNKWDSPLQLDKLWEQYNRLIKINGAIVLFGSQPFTSMLIASNIKYFRYSLVWEKTTPTGFLNANKMPLRIHEDILVFYKSLPVYNPQKTSGHKPVNHYIKHTNDGTNYGKTAVGVSGGGQTERYPVSILKFKTDKQKQQLHPTQKPIALCRYLIETFSDVGDTILDSCAGSGTTGAAAEECGRNSIMIEKEATYCEIITKRMTKYDEALFA